VRSLKKKSLLKQIVIYTLIAIIVYCCVSFAFTAILFNQIFARGELNIYEIAPDYADIDAEQYPRMLVNFQSGSNQLQGYIYNAVVGAEGLILPVHGFGSRADHYLPEIMYFVDSGWCVFAFDGTGTGESEGSSLRGLPQAEIDLRAALDYIYTDDTLNKYPVALYGQSMGAYAVATMLRDCEYEIAAAVCVSGFNTTFDAMQWQAKKSVGAISNLMYPFVPLYEFFLFGRDAGGSAVAGINASEIPILIVYGTDDDTVPFDVIGIPAHADEITNPYVVFLPCDAAYRNQHCTVHLTQDAAAYLLETRAALSDLHARYGPTLPEAEWRAFYESLDRERLYAVDTDYLQTIIDFFRVAL